MMERVLGVELVAALLLVLVAMAAPAARAQAGVNLAKNGDFESGETGPWTPNWAWAKADAQMTVVRSATEAMAGRHALRVACRNDKLTQWHGNGLTLEAGKAYRVSFHYRGERATKLTGQVRLIPPPWTSFGKAEVIPVLEWNRAEFLFVSPETRRDAAVYFSFEGGGTVWIDDVTVTELDIREATPTRLNNLLANGSFEVEPHLEDWVVLPLNKWELDASSPAHGGRSLKLVAHNRPREIRSNTLRLTPFCPHTLSFRLRAERPGKATLALRGQQGSTEAVLFEQTVDIGTQWQEFRVTGNSKVADSYFVSFKTHANGAVWLDSAWLSEGDAPAAYAPAARVEASVRVASDVKLFRAGESVPVAIHVVNHGAGASRGAIPFRWRVVDWQGRTVREGGGRGEAGVESRLILRDVPLGVHRLVVEPEGGEATAAVFGVAHRLDGRGGVASPFGGHFDFMNPTVRETVQKLGLVWARAHWPPGWTQWRQLEPKKGEWKFRDEVIQTAQREGFHILGMIQTTPPWAVPGNGYVAKPGAYAQAFPQDLEDWRNYVRTVVGRYPQITAWEIYNEPHVAHFWQGTDKDLQTLFVEATRAIRSERPGAAIVGFYWPIDPEHRAMFAPVTAMSEHYYAHGATIEQRMEEIEQHVRRVQSKSRAIGRADGVEVWNTEFGPGNWGSLRRMGETEHHRRAVEYMIKHVVSQRTLGVSKFFPYLFAPSLEVNHGALDVDAAPRTGVMAYATTVRFLEGAEPLGRVKTGRSKLELHRFRRGDEGVVFVWSASKHGDLALPPAATPLTAYDEMGNALPEPPAAATSLPHVVAGPDAQVEQWLEDVKRMR